MSTTEANLAPSGGEVPNIAGFGVENSSSKPTEEQIVQSFNQPSEKPAETSQVQEQEEPEQAPAEQQEQKPGQPGADNQATAGDDEEEVQPLTEEDLSIAKIQQFAKDMPELKAAFDKNPAVRNTIFAMARRSARLNEFQQVYQTVEQAKFAAENSEQFMQLNELFFGEGKEDPVNFWNQLYENSLLRDPQSGELVLDPQNQRPVSTGAYERVAGAYREAMFYQLEQNVRTAGLDKQQQQQALDAIAWVKEMTGDGQRPQPQEKQQEFKLSPQQERELAEARELKSRYQQESSQRQTEWRQETFSTIVGSIKEDIGGQVKRIVETQSVALTPYEQKNIVNDIWNAVDELAANNKQFQLHFNNLLARAPMTETGRKSLVTEAKKFYKEVLPPVVSRILKEVTSQTVEKQKIVTDKRVAQTQRKEVKTTGSAPSPSSQDIKSKAQELRKQLKRPLTEDEILALS